MTEKVRRTPAKLHKLVKDMDLEVLVRGSDFDTREVTVSDVNRPALQLVGFYQYFEPQRLQIFGNSEINFLKTMPVQQRRRVLDDLLRCEIPALIIARDLEIFPELVELTEKHSRTLLRSQGTTVETISRIIGYLNRQLAAQITRHGVLMNIYGQGVLILGDSGVGKSETAIELLKRGHRLVSDDAVEIRRVAELIYGTAPELIQHYIEIRGVGVIDVQQLFGMGAVQFETEIDMVIQLEQWVDGKFYDRLGLGEDSIDILGVSRPIVTIPVRPGRNLAGIVEIATMKNRQMKYGFNPARDFVTQFDRHVDEMMANSKEN
ncbi:MAG: HPr(Ser) kinase/phosphatase [Eubacteriales bacterium]|nr:HPr(Ser) kinase/phosphatase [Eubacteriales bacterium]